MPVVHIDSDGNLYDPEKEGLRSGRQVEEGSRDHQRAEKLQNDRAVKPSQNRGPGRPRKNS